jgi:type IV pilus assembly protein PilC
VKVVGTVKRRTLSALIYPVILILLSVVVVSIIVIRVVPEFGAFYAGFGRELPLSTRIIVAVSDIVRAWWLLIFGGGAAMVMAIYGWTRRDENRLLLHRALLRLPFAGPTARKFATAQLARTLATLLGGGIPLVNAINVAGRAIGNRFMAAELDAVGQRVREGESMAMAMNARGEFPDVAVKMVEVGESTGALQDMLNSLADFYDEEIETALARFVTLIEPSLLVIMGIIIATLLLALYMPVFELSRVG